VPRLVRDRRTWISYAQLAIFGYFIYGFGPIVPLLRDEQQTSRTVASLHGTTFAVGAALGGFVLPYLVGRLGRRTVIWVGLAGVATATAGFWLSHALPATLTWAFVGSMFGGFAVNGIVATLSDLHGAGGPAAISEANAGAAAAGVVAPLVIGAAVTAGFGWRPGLAVVVAAVVVVAVAALIFPVPPTARPAAVADPATGNLPVTYWLAWLSLVATGSVEVCLNLWVADVLRSHAHVSPGGAAAAVSAIIAGMTAGRLVGGRLVLRFGATTVILGALALSAAGFTVFWLATAPWLAIAGLVVTGLGNALHYPLGVGLAVEYSGGRPDLAAARSSYAMALSFGGAPFLLGAVADGIGPHLAFLLVPVFLAASAVTILALRRRVVALPAAELEAA
jgi:MFS family permease